MKKKNVKQKQVGINRNGIEIDKDFNVLNWSKNIFKIELIEKYKRRVNKCLLKKNI
jgi:hypothetical protein